MSTHPTDTQTFALETVSKVLGPIRARMLLDTFLARRERDRLETADDLQEFGRELGSYGGTEESIGARLCRQAVLLGASDNQG